MNKNIQSEKENPHLKVVLVGVNASYSHTNLAIRYLSKYVLQNETIRSNVNIVCHEFTINDTIREDVACLLQDDADIYGFSCYIWNITMVLEMTAMLKSLKPGCHIILGGPEVSFEKEAFLHLHPEISLIVRGPGEEAFSELLLDAWTRRMEGWEDRSARIIDGKSVSLDEIPFVYLSEDFAQKQKLYYYETTRGCPFCCSYCLSSTIEGMSALPVDRVKQELEFFIRQEIKQLKLVDRTFNYDDERAIEIWAFLIETYRQKPFSTNFHFEIAGDLLSPKALSLLHEAPLGLFQFEIGVQTTSKTVLGNIRRKTASEKIAGNVKKIMEEGNITLHLDLIAGLPGEDWTSFGRAFNETLRLRPDMLQLGFLKVLKGSPIRQDAKRFGLLYSPNPPYEILETSSMTFFELNRLKKMEELLERYYNSLLFRHSMAYLLGVFPDSFDFFEKFEAVWESKGLFKIKISRKESIREFYFFGETMLLASGRESKDDELRIFADLLKFDYYRYDKKGNIGELDFNFGSHHPALPRALEKSAWYHSNGQPLCKKPRLEHYRFNANLLLDSGRVEPGNSFVLYDMGGDRPVIVDVLAVDCGLQNLETIL